MVFLKFLQEFNEFEIFSTLMLYCVHSEEQEWTSGTVESRLSWFASPDSSLNNYLVGLCIL